jgi:hypothetical protein
MNLLDMVGDHMQSGEDTVGLNAATAALLHAPCLLLADSDGIVTAARNEALDEILRCPKEEQPKQTLIKIHDFLLRRKKHRGGLQPVEEGARPATKGLAKAAARVVRLAAAGEVSRAAKALEAMGGADGGVLDASSPVVAARLKELHPDASAADIIHDLGSERLNSLRVTHEDVARGIDECPRLSAGALTPWTFDLLRCLSGKDGKILEKKMTRIFNFLLDGKGGDPSLWITSRIVPLGKPDGGVRPIAIGEVWLRLLAKIATKKVAPVGKSLAPLQYGGGFKGGAEVIIHLCGMFAKWVQAREGGLVYINPSVQDPNDPWVLVAVDLSNAFNTIHRGAVGRAVRERCPQLFHFYRWAYGQPSDLRSEGGKRVCHSATGVRQGDPLGPLFFCLGIQRVLEDLKVKHPLAYALFYMDDGTILGPRSEVVKAVAFLQGEFLKIGLQMNMKPSKTTGWDATLDKGKVDYGFSWTNQGVKILGTAVGGSFETVLGKEASFAREYVKSELAKRGKILPFLKHLDRHTAFVILRSAINTRPTFLARASSPSTWAGAEGDFDEAIDEALAEHVLGCKGRLPDTALTLRGLPAAEGGVSLQRLERSKSNAYLASWSLAAWHIAAQHNWLWRMCLEARVLDEEADLMKVKCPGFRRFDDRGIHVKVEVGEEEESAAPITGQHQPRLLGDSQRKLKRQEIAHATYVQVQKEWRQWTPTTQLERRRRGGPAWPQWMGTWTMNGQNGRSFFHRKLYSAETTPTLRRSS